MRTAPLAAALTATCAVWLLASCTSGDPGDPAAATSLALPGTDSTAAATTAAASTVPVEETSGAAPVDGVDGVDGVDPTAVTTAFGDDYLAMLSDPADRSLRTSPWASPSGLAFMNSRAEQAVADGISATGPWAIEATSAGDSPSIAVVDGCIDVTRVTGYRNGVAEPWQGDRILFTATLERAGDGWLVSNFNIPGDACPD